MERRLHLSWSQQAKWKGPEKEVGVLPYGEVWCSWRHFCGCNREEHETLGPSPLNGVLVPLRPLADCPVCTLLQQRYTWGTSAGILIVISGVGAVLLECSGWRPGVFPHSAVPRHPTHSAMQPKCPRCRCEKMLPCGTNSGLCLRI